MSKLLMACLFVGVLNACGGGAGTADQVTAVTAVATGRPSLQMLAVTGDATDDLTGLRFVATWPDLVWSVGANPQAAFAMLEGTGPKDVRLKRPFFSPENYLEESPAASQLCASATDSLVCATNYFITEGFKAREGWTELASLLYIASYADLRSRFGIDAAAAAAHYQSNGIVENRFVSFNVAAWLDANAQTAARLNDSFEAAVRYFIRNGSTAWTDTQAFRIFSNNLCLGVANGSMTSGSNVVSSDCNGSSRQRWLAQADGRIRSNDNPSLCMVPVGGVAEGSTLQMTSCTNADTAQWYAGNIKGVSSSDLLMCFDTVDGSLSAGRQIVLKSCDLELRSQWWHIRQ